MEHGGWKYTPNLLSLLFHQYEQPYYYDILFL